MHKKILILCPYPFGVAGGQRLKYEQYFNHWKTNGYEIEVASFFDLELWNVLYEPSNYFKKIFGTIKGFLRRLIILFKVKNYDSVYIFMWVAPFRDTFFERCVSKLAKSVIFDFDDFVHIDQLGSNESIMSAFFSRLKSGHKKTNYLIHHSDHVIISSPFHLEYCRALNKKNNCDYIPCSLNTDRFLPKKVSKEEKKVTIGWTGTFSSKPYLDSIKNVLYEVNKTHDYKLRIIGNFDYKLPGIDLEVINWSLTKEIEDLQAIDIGIYPIFTDEWGLGKGGLKAMQYMAIGIPVVATDYGTSSDILNHKKDSLLVKNEKEWAEALIFLIENPEKRKVYGEPGRQNVVKNYSVETVKSKYLAILNANCL